MNAADVLREHAYADCPQFTVPSPLLKNITNTYPVGSFAKYLLRSIFVYCERCSLLFTPTLHEVFVKHPKTRNQ